MTKQEFESFIETDDGQRVLQPILDKRVSDAIRTYRENHPVPEVEGYETKIASKDAEISRLKIENHLIEQCHDRNIPVTFVRELGLRFDDISEIDSRLELLETRIEAMTNQSVNQRLVTGFKPGGAPTVETPDVRHMTAERVAFLDEIGELDNMLTP